MRVCQNVLRSREVNSTAEGWAWISRHLVSPLFFYGIYKYRLPPTLFSPPTVGGQTRHRCQFSGGQYANHFGQIDPNLDPSVSPPTRDFPLWDSGSGGYVQNCEFPLKLMDDNKGTAVRKS